MLLIPRSRAPIMQPFSVAPKFREFARPARYKVAHGGRGSSKSWSVARMLLAEAHTTPPIDNKPWRCGCFRETQTSIAESVHRLLVDQAGYMKILDWFKVTENSIQSRATGAEFIFKGLRHNLQEIKSTEGLNRAWVEEAQNISEDSWEVLIPTIRTEEKGSNREAEIYVTFNPNQDSDPTFKRFVVRPPPDAVVLQVNWNDNPWFNRTLDRERRYLMEIDPEAYEHVWGGACKTIGDAVIFRDRYCIENFEAPRGVQFHYGADFGFSKDPSTLIRCYVIDDELYIDYEAFGYGVELDDLGKMYAGKAAATERELATWTRADDDKWPGIPGAMDWPIKADGARPETISYLARRGFSIREAKKWKGSVEDGITHMKGFRRIHIHERCKRTAQEFRLYSFKVDRVTKDVLPIIISKHDHAIDAIRYSLDGYIQQSGMMGIWERLAG